MGVVWLDALPPNCLKKQVSQCGVLLAGSTYHDSYGLSISITSIFWKRHARTKTEVIYFRFSQLSTLIRKRTKATILGVSLRRISHENHMDGTGCSPALGTCRSGASCVRRDRLHSGCQGYYLRIQGYWRSRWRCRPHPD